MQYILLLSIILSFIHSTIQENIQVLSCSSSSLKEEKIRINEIIGRSNQESMKSWTQSISFCNDDTIDPSINSSSILSIFIPCTIQDHCKNCSQFKKRRNQFKIAHFNFISSTLNDKPSWLEDSFSTWISIERDTTHLYQFSECSIIEETDALKSFSKTSVLFVSISFIILMVISLAWLVFYYVQRFRYAHAKDRLQRRLFNAAKKALNRMPARSIKSDDIELDGDCPICIDPYATGDIVRTLPCKHVFHKTCIDPWLLDHRTCPMCKLDILKACGYQVSNESRRDEEREVEGRIEVPHEPISIPEVDRVRVVSQVHIPPSNSAVFIERTRPTRVSSRPSSSSHIVNLVHVRSRSASCVPPRVATFRSHPSNHSSSSQSPPSSPSPIHIPIQVVHANVHSNNHDI